MIARSLSYFGLRRLWHDNLGATATEYAFIVAFISIVSATGMVVMGNNLSSFYNTIGGVLANVACEMPETASDTGKENSNRCK
jgi:Flp pilus assembly pilin Flp